jgi:hypothetical protein
MDSDWCSLVFENPRSLKSFARSAGFDDANSTNSNPRIPTGFFDDELTISLQILSI